MTEAGHRAIAGVEPFRHDIQGLRAVAVLAVILNHLEIGAFQGGYVGVDIFFVISGYLITRLLKDELVRTGSIGLRSFYTRRIRRLFPAAIVTCVLALAAAFLLSSQEKLELLAASGLASLFSVANIYFWSQVGYFDAEASGKPLLHMWSLGVEEQFYLFWPFLLLIAFRFRKTAHLIGATVALGALSFLMNHLWLATALPDLFSGSRGVLGSLANPQASAFYLMPFRVFEFAIGALVALVALPNPKTGAATHRFILFAACASLLYAVTQFDKDTHFPYWSALWVACATAGIIGFGQRSTHLSTLLTHPMLVYIGTISYSLYLVHWPLIVYYRDLTGPLGGWDRPVLLLLTIGAGTALHHLIEKPARYGYGTAHSSAGFSRTRHRSLGLTWVALGSVALLCFAAPKVDGRIPEHRMTLADKEWRHIERTRFCLSPIPGFPAELFTCQLHRGKAQTIILWGDSHALHLVGGFAEHFPNANVAVAYRSGCVTQNGFGDYIRQTRTDEETRACIEHNKKLLDWLTQATDKHMVFISNAKRDQPGHMAAINNFLLSQLVQAGHEAWVLGDYIRPGTSMTTCFAVPDVLLTDRMLAKVCQPDKAMVESELAYAEAMSAQSDRYISLHDVQCPQRNCRYVDDKGRPTFRDTHHLSYVGAGFEVGKAMPLLLAKAPPLGVFAGQATVEEKQHP